MSRATKESFAYVLLAGVLLAAGCERSPSSPAESYVSEPLALRRGEQIFTGTCGGYCHSKSRENREAPYLFDCVWLHGGRDVDLFSTISHGRAGTQMLGFAGKLPDGDEDIWKVIAFLKSKRQC